MIYIHYKNNQTENSPLFSIAPTSLFPHHIELLFTVWSISFRAFLRVCVCVCVCVYTYVFLQLSLSLYLAFSLCVEGRGICVDVLFIFSLFFKAVFIAEVNLFCFPSVFRYFRYLFYLAIYFI